MSQISTNVNAAELGQASDQNEFLPEGFQPSCADVIIGRGNKCRNHAGNERLRSIVATRLEQYSMAVTKREKTDVLSAVVVQIRAGEPNGKFIKQDPATKLWFDVGDTLAREKISQAFRDALVGLYRSSNDFKKKRRRAMKAEDEHARPLKHARLQQVTEYVNQILFSSIDGSINEFRAVDSPISPLLHRNINHNSDAFEPTSIVDMAKGDRIFLSNLQNFNDCFAKKNDNIQLKAIEFSDELEEIDISGLLPLVAETRKLKDDKISTGSPSREYFDFRPATNINSAKMA